MPAGGLADSDPCSPIFSGLGGQSGLFLGAWTGRAGHSVQSFVLAVSACLLALFAPLTVWLLPEPWSLGAGYFFWHGSMLLYAWKSRTAGEAVWPVA